MQLSSCLFYHNINLPAYPFSRFLGKVAATEDDMAEVGMKDEEVMAPEEIDELILGGIAGSLATSIGCSS